MSERPSSEEIYANFAPLAKWLNPADPEAAQPILDEDAVKRDRLMRLSEMIGLPIPPYTYIDPVHIDDTDAMRAYFGDVDEAKDRFAVAYLPKEEGGQVLRHRGLSLDDSIVWGQENKPMEGDYTFLIEPSYENNRWSTIFVVNDKGVYGELIPGQHFQLTQGRHVDADPLEFLIKDGRLFTKGKTWHGALDVIWDFVKDITVSNRALQPALSREIGAEFTPSDQLKGYFEAVVDERFGKAFIDYNRSLLSYFEVPDRLMPALRPEFKGSAIPLVGKLVVDGVAEGKLMTSEQIAADDSDNFILTAELTRAEDVPVMHVAEAIVTEMGGVTSHAAIVARMLGKPCLVGVANATKYLGRDAIFDGPRRQILVQ